MKFISCIGLKQCKDVKERIASSGSYSSSYLASSNGYGFESSIAGTGFKNKAECIKFLTQNYHVPPNVAAKVV